MKSRITIDLDFYNNPIIKIEYIESEDVRDTLVKRFLEQFASESCWAYFQFDNSNEFTVKHNLNAGVSVIRPIPPIKLEEEIPKIKLCVDSYKELYASIEKSKKDLK